MNRLNNHNGIIDHNGDGKKQGRQSKQVDREAQQVEEEEGTNQRYRHCNDRDKRRTEVLKEYVNHEEHQHEGEHQGEHNLLDRCVKEGGYIIVDIIRQSRREVLGQRFQLGLDLRGNLVSVRT